MSKLKRLTIKGFRSIKEATVEFRPLNVLIGANGAGKSNLISFFKLMYELTAGRLQQFIATTGRASGNLYFGPKVTPQLEVEMEFNDDQGTNTYKLRLSHAAGDSLVFSREMLWLQSTDSSVATMTLLGVGDQESKLDEWAVAGDVAANVLRHHLQGCRVYHFHDTSPMARVRLYGYVGDNRILAHDAANLAAILYKLQTQSKSVYRRIVETIRQVAPFFDDFDLRPEGTVGRETILNWKHRNSDLVFGPHQLSDGTLRAICLISLLLQPVEDLPYLIVVDEPELGLHPYALNLVASLFRAASHHTQILVSTQSTTFLDNFDAADIILVERDKNDGTTFRRPDEAQLDAWLEDYSLGEIWEKNVMGGGPH